MSSKLGSLKRRKIVSIVNRTDVLQTHYTDDGEIYQLAPHEVRDISGTVAEGFIAECGARNVAEYKPTPIPVRPGEPMVHVANMTGNPFIPKLIEIVKFDKETGGNKVSYAENPKIKPQVIKHTMQLGEKIQPSKLGEGDECISLGSVNVEIPPYGIHLIPTRIANWLSNREANTAEFSGFNAFEIINGGIPDFRPNENWELDEIRYWIKMVRPDTDGDILGETEKDIIKNGGTEEEITEHKIKLIHASHFLIADSRYNAPSQEKFKMMYEKYKTSLAKEARVAGMRAKKSLEAKGQSQDSVAP